jgi:hypothetical protein
MAVSVRTSPRVMCKRMTRGVSGSKELVDVGRVLRVMNERSRELDMSWEWK